jgi:Leucine-rich repeat (LRR) protein
MGLGESSYDIENLCNVLLYNETLVTLSVSHNSISKLTPLMTNIVRNRMSNLLEFDLSYNQIDIEEFIGMLAKNNMSKESAFGNLHFKLRMLNLQ